jgi:hypothetical protein
MAYISVLVTYFTLALITFTVSARQEDLTLSTTSPAFTDGFLFRRALFVVRVIRLNPEMSIKPSARYSDVGENARWLAIQSLHVWSQRSVAYLITSCHQKRAYKNYLHMATFSHLIAIFTLSRIVFRVSVLTYYL